MDIKIFLLPFCFGIIFAGIIRLSNDALSDDEDEKVGYNELQICIDDTRYTFDVYRLQKDMNTSVDPCIDLYEYSCGNWQKNNPIPVNYVKWSTFLQIQHETYHRVHELLIKEDEDNELPFIKIAKQYHRSCINEVPIVIIVEAIEKKGLKPMKLMWEVTGEWPILMSNKQWYKKNYTWQNTYNTYNELYGFNNIFSLVYKQDERDKARNIFQIYNSLDDEEQLLKDTCPRVNGDTIVKVVQAFAADERIFIPIEKIRTDVNEIITFERKLRKLISKEEKQEVMIMSIEKLQEFYDSLTKTLQPSAKINWLDMIQSNFKDINIIINASETVLVNRKFLREIAILLDATPPRIIVNYVQWNMVCRLMKYLNKQMRNIEYDFSLKTKNQRKPRWLRCVQAEWIQDITSYLYVKEYISADVIKIISEMVNEIRTEIKELISLSPLMNNITKEDMMNKLDKVLSYISKPNWYDNETFIELYDGLKFGENYFQNRLAIEKHGKQMYAKLLAKNINIWPIYPLNVQALFSRRINRWHDGVIFVPAAIIQEPFFVTNRPSAFNYGALGSVIGHELVHSIDMEKGSWKCFIDYYNNITLGVTDEDGKSIPYGIISLKENVADVIGLQAAFAAFKKSRTKMDQPSIKWWSLENVTHEQLFFLSFANMMCTATVRGVIPKASAHSPNNFRVIGAVSNTKFFSEAFKCSMGSPMNSESKCKIWE